MIKKIDSFCNNYKKFEKIKDDVSFFDLSSHKRAKDAISFSLSLKDSNVFIIAEDGSGRVSATIDYLNTKVEFLKRSDDWFYLNNFEEINRPKSYSLPPGDAKIFKNMMEDLISDTSILFKKTFSHYLNKVKINSLESAKKFQNSLSKVQEKANLKGLIILEIDGEFKIEIKEDAKYSFEDFQEIQDDLDVLTIDYIQETQKIEKKIKKLRCDRAIKIIKPLFEKIIIELKIKDEKLLKWTEDASVDIVKNFDSFLSENNNLINPIERYAVNILIDNSSRSYPKIILESDPSFESLFGEIKYKSSPQLETNHTMIRAGAFHRASGGVLIIRADQVAKNQKLWDTIKSAIRDKKIRITNSNKENFSQIIDAPNPESIPMDVKIFLIGSPFWYYSFFFNDSDFKSHFKIKAEIDHDMEISDENLFIYISLLQKHSIALSGKKMDDNCVSYLIDYSSRLTSNCTKLSSQFDILKDILNEAFCISSNTEMTKENVQKAIDNRRDRNMRSENYVYETIDNNQIIVETVGHKLGQVNALSVVESDHGFGMPSRITSRTYVGDGGILNIERAIGLGGPIEQKATLTIEGFLNGIFAQYFQLPCGISITFEQSYNDIDGDSASLAEMVAIFSSLSEIKVRQDIAITGSMDQLGNAQAVGGIHHKIEAWHKICSIRGLSGTQGVIIPKTNTINLTIKDNVREDIKRGAFHIFTVSTIFDALEIMLSAKCGIKIEEFESSKYFEKGSIFEKTFSKLKSYKKLLNSKDSFKLWS